MQKDGMTKDTVQHAEIEKCDLLCIFCHKAESWNNGDYISRWLLPEQCQTIEEGDDIEDDDVPEDLDSQIDKF